MKLQIKRIADAKIINDERFVLKASGNTDVGNYLVLCSGLLDGEISNKLQNSYWFPDTRIERGDNVVLYTKAGRDRKKSLPDGSTSHFFYWGLDKPIWNLEKNAPVLIHVESWISHVPSYV